MFSRVQQIVSDRTYLDVINWVAIAFLAHLNPQTAELFFRTIFIINFFALQIP
ncbi:hypothetical protein [Merismopedia glauca]|uniref:hypothetical protein n=1 Tax=Merismopedia glauca TaxID=292586 RepID=UPI0015E78EF9|nr:hypothetical protein [Merismopedia glauca]